MKNLFVVTFVALAVLGATDAEADVNVIGSWAIGLNHTKESGVNRALIFIAHGEHANDMNLASVTYGVQQMTKVMERNYFASQGRAYAAAFILKESGIVAATNNTFVPTWATDMSSNPPGYASIFLTNVNQAGSTGATSSSGATTNTVTSSAIVNNSGDMVLVAATCGQSGSYVLNNGFTEGTDQQIGGTVTGVTGHKYATGASETPSATWSGSSDINRQMIMGFVVKAFAPITRTLTVSSSAGGTVTQPGIGAFVYPDGNIVNLVASADVNYHFLNWTGTAVTAGKVANPYLAATTVAMDANYTVAANFAENTVGPKEISGIITAGSLNLADVNLVGLGVVTDINGFYTAIVDYNWSGTVTPVKPGYTFDPNSITYINVIYEQLGQNYRAFPIEDFNDNRRGSMWRVDS
ncbi:MAG: hypothetical protein JW749_02415 [Sedimentisphaerales bacterium]|nr:hypothetical protein [Sedimentisphaerales bacterium]